MSSKMPIHRFGQPNHESLHTAAQRTMVGRLHNQMKMLELNGIVGYPERAAIGFSYCGLNHWVQTSKRWERSTDPKRRMHGMVALVLFSWEMGHTRKTWVGGLPTRTFAASPVGLELQWELTVPHS